MSDHINTGKRFHTFVVACNKSPGTKQLMRAWINIKNKERKAKRIKTSTGREHLVIEVPEKAEDMRFTLPKSESGGKKKDGKGLRSILEGAGAGVGEKITFTWAVCYVNDIQIDTTKDGWEKFECSHLCCELDENGKRIVGLRCVDPACLTWESKSNNQSRANPTCRKQCHCGCGDTICAANNAHSPHCH